METGTDKREYWCEQGVGAKRQGTPVQQEQYQWDDLLGNGNSRGSAYSGMAKVEGMFLWTSLDGAAPMTASVDTKF